MRRLHVLVPAGGSGERFGGPEPKQLAEVAGRPVLRWTLERLLALDPVCVVVALPSGRELPLGEWGLPPGRVSWVAGGATRQLSVAACLAALPPGDDLDLVAVHDGARPATALGDMRAVVAAAARTGAAVLGRRLSDTVKRLAGDRIAGTLERQDLFRAETPQVFHRHLLAEALARAAADGVAGTDESALVERLAGVEIVAVEAEQPNPKLTVPGDLDLLARLLAGEPA
jgi:2-C-methyl-D-erythritol 4-phosphate cytidylyltransferase